MKGIIYMKYDFTPKTFAKLKINLIRNDYGNFLMPPFVHTQD